MILNEDKRKDPPSAASTSVNEMLALECFAAVKADDAAKFARSLGQMIELELMKKGN